MSAAPASAVLNRMPLIRSDEVVHLALPIARAPAFGLPVLLLLSFLTACAGPRQPGSSAPNPPTSVVPITTAAHTRSLDEARTLLGKDACDPAARLLNRQSPPSAASPALAETRYLLARCYERQGRLSAAFSVYELLALTPGGPRDDSLAQLRELRQRPDLMGPRGGVTGIMVQASALPSNQELEAWMTRLADAGVTTLIVEVGSSQRSTDSRRSRAQAAGVYFQTTLAPVLRDVIGEVIPLGHRHHMRVFSAVCLDQMEWIEPHFGWNDMSYDLARHVLTPSAQLDLFNPAFREYLNGFLADLAQTGVDGMLFRFAGRPADGFSGYAAAAFEREFHTSLEPLKILTPTRPGAGDSATVPRNERTSGVSPQYWRWVGWKTRQHIKVLETLVKAGRRNTPGLQFALELHQESITDPMKALIQYGEDLLEAKQSSVQFLVIPGSPSVSGSASERGSAEPNGAQRAGEPTVLISRARELLGGVDRLWITGRGNGRVFQKPIRSTMDRAATLPADVGLIYDERR
jgi:hypothetical protein